MLSIITGYILIDNYVLSKYRYERAFVDFFEDELVRRNYDWKDVMNAFLFTGDEPLFSSVIADRMLQISFIHSLTQYDTKQTLFN